MLLWTLSSIKRSFTTRPTNTSRMRPGSSWQEELPVGEVRQQKQSVSAGVQDLVCIPKTRIQKTHPVQVCQAPMEIREKQNWIQDKFNFLKMHIRCKGCRKSSGFKSLAQGASVSTASTHDISRGFVDTDSYVDQHMIRHHRFQAPV